MSEIKKRLSIILEGPKDNIEEKLQKVCHLLDQEISYFNWTGFYFKNGDKGNFFISAYLTQYWWFTLNHVVYRMESDEIVIIFLFIIALHELIQKVRLTISKPSRENDSTLIFKHLLEVLNVL